MTNDISPLRIQVDCSVDIILLSPCKEMRDHQGAHLHQSDILHLVHPVEQ